MEPNEQKPAANTALILPVMLSAGVVFTVIIAVVLSLLKVSSMAVLVLALFAVADAGLAGLFWLRYFITRQTPDRNKESKLWS